MRRIGAIAVLGFAIVLAGCAIPPGFGPDPRVDAVPVSTATCPETFEEGHTEAGLVPKDFDAVAVLRCDPYASQQDGDELWSGVLLERLEGELEAVLAALAMPSDPRSLGPCPAVAYLSPELWIEGRDGNVVRVAIPADGCGAPKQVGLEAALDALTVVEQTFTRDSLLESIAATTAGCATQAGMLVLAGLDEVDGMDAEPIVPDGDHVFGEEYLVPYEMPEWPDSSEVTGARLCDYVATAASERAPAPAGNGGVFVGMRELAASEAQTFVSDARIAPAAPSCAEVATRFVVVHLHLGEHDAVSFTVELDGCRRIADPALQSHAASPAVLALLTPPK
ncbi:hypothetical protein [Microbacterium sp.]|uniref:hypothetical protein n=1 Tax=Microbacterium sp. TaxID=51671 RepID=UPI0027329DBE|nr:hypothetical protein [Microbacterium sp.]MDP3951975.1 hypothetical protein [Microbacterium sp.]